MNGEKKMSITNSVSLAKQYELCSSCGLCESFFKKTVKMDLTTEGRYYPKLIENMTQEDNEKFRRLCPVTNYTSPKSSKNFHHIIGHYFDYYYGYSCDDSIRKRASTGGGITSFASFLLKKKYVDGVFHLGKTVDIFRAEGVLSKTVEDIVGNAGSKYMPATLLINILEILDKEECIAIIGKPCDLRGIDNLLELMPHLRKKIFLKISFLCGGVPSINSTYKIINEFGVDKNNVQELQYRGNGWPGQFQIKTNDEKNYSMNYDTAWGKNLGRTVPLACKLCFDSIGDSADIVFGDAWECDESGYPIFNESDGRNLIITRNKKADFLLNQSSETEFLKIEKADVSDFCKMQPSQTIRRSSAKIKSRVISFFPLRKISYDSNYIRMLSSSNFSKIKVAKLYIGTIKRIFKTSRRDILD